MPAGRLLAVPLELVPAPDVADFEPEPEAQEVEPTVLPVVPDPELDPAALAWLLSRAMLAVCSQH
jgi:hypothetical protein